MTSRHRAIRQIASLIGERDSAIADRRSGPIIAAIESESRNAIEESVDKGRNRGKLRQRDQYAQQNQRSDQTVSASTSCARAQSPSGPEQVFEL